MARTYRFFCRNEGMTHLLEQSQQVLAFTEDIESEIFFQLTKVLRVQIGDTVVLLPASSDGPNMEYVFEVADISKKMISLKLNRTVENTNELPFQLSLVVCLPNKPEKLEFIIQKAVEIGVTHITFVEGDFSQMKHQLRLDRLQKILVEAAEQSERGKVPELTVAGKLHLYLQNLSAPEKKQLYVAMERLGDGGNASLSKVLLTHKPAEQIQILVGPEGGFSDAEKKLITELGLTCFSLGKRVLRMETAVVLSLGVVPLLLAS